MGLSHDIMEEFKYSWLSAYINPKTLQYLMGHSDIAVTMNVYTHLGLDDARVELARLKEAKNELKFKKII